MGYYGLDAYGYPAIPLDPHSIYGAGFGMGGSPAHAKGQAKSKGKNNQGKKKNAEGGQKNNRAYQPATASGETVQVGRIVGFWPNYQITYDEVPATGQSSAGNRAGNRGKKAKSKA